MLDRIKADHTATTMWTVMMVVCGGVAQLLKILGA
jgi:hypothetical protein